MKLVPDSTLDSGGNWYMKPMTPEDEAKMLANVKTMPTEPGYYKFTYNDGQSNCVEFVEAEGGRLVFDSSGAGNFTTPVEDAEGEWGPLLMRPNGDVPQIATEAITAGLMSMQEARTIFGLPLVEVEGMQCPEMPKVAKLIP